MLVETRFTLTLENKEADTEMWVKKIGLKPWRSVIKGHHLTKNPHSKISEDSFILLGVERSEEPSIEGQITRIVDQLYAKRKEIKALISEEGLQAYGETFFWPDEEKDMTIILNQELIKRMNELEIHFTLKRYD